MLTLSLSRLGAIHRDYQEKPSMQENMCLVRGQAPPSLLQKLKRKRLQRLAIEQEASPSKALLANNV
jgi:hypothetical protein